MGFSLATLFVDFSARGTDTVSGAFKAVTADVDAFVARVQSAESRIDKMWIVAKTGAQAFTNAIGYATLGIAGFVTAGLQGTMEGERLTLSFKLLSQEIAAVFMPIVEKLTDSILAVVRWFRSLDETTQNLISSTAVWVVGLAVAIAIIPKAVAFIMTMVRAYQMLAVAIAVVTGLSGGWAKVIAGIAAGAAVYGAFKLLGSGGDETGRHRRVTPQGRGMESVKGTYDRIQIAATKLDGERTDRQILEGIQTNTGATREAVQGTTEAVKNIPRAQSAINDKSAVGAGNDDRATGSGWTANPPGIGGSNVIQPRAPAGAARGPANGFDITDNRNWRLPGGKPFWGNDD